MEWLAAARVAAGRLGLLDTGKAVRLAAILRPDGRTFIGALDVFIPRGVLPGLRDPVSTARLFVDAGADALLMHEGLVDTCLPAFGGRAALIVKLTTASWEAEDSTRRVQVTTVRRAAALGASAVAANCFLGDPHDGELLAQRGRIAEACAEYGMPLIPLINPRPRDQFNAERVAYVCRVGAELGGDLVKSDYPGTPDAFSAAVATCTRPVIIEESPLAMTPEGTLRTVDGVLRAGGAGVMFANRIWDAPRAEALAQSVAGMIHGRWSLEHALQHVQQDDSR
jgi:fructose-bisphosphate aldolase/2-amino-3,7-dideoxy-D-threo-hept-6-ulosonate synthase